MHFAQRKSPGQPQQRPCSSAISAAARRPAIAAGAPVATAASSSAAKWSLCFHPFGTDNQLLADAADLVQTGEKRRCLNLGSYNYLGFGGVEAHCTPAVEAALDAHGAGVGASRLECGHRPEHAALEAAVAAFLGKEAALVTGMGFATNSTVLPCLVDPRGDGRGVLVLSDALNHASIVEGVRVSGAAVWPFAHNDVAHLEVQLRRAMARGRGGCAAA